MNASPMRFKVNWCLVGYQFVVAGVLLQPDHGDRPPEPGVDRPERVAFRGQGHVLVQPGDAARRPLRCRQTHDINLKEILIIGNQKIDEMIFCKLVKKERKNWHICKIIDFWATIGHIKLIEATLLNIEK